MHRLIAAILLGFFSLVASTQEVVWDVDASLVFNNREGGDEQTPDQTFLFSRLNAEVGVALGDGEHAFKGGVSWYQPMIDNGSGYKVLPLLYYQYHHDQWTIAVGAMPRTLIKGRLPRFLWSDSLNYCQPRLRGVLARFARGESFAEMALDWRQMQTQKQREAFNVLFNVDWAVAGGLMLGGHVQYNHLAKRKNAPEGEGVNDDATINAMVGYDFTRHTSLDLLRLDVGAVVQMQRCRALDHWETPAGFVLQARLRKSWFEVGEDFFAGKDLFPLYLMFGSELNLGDPYYRSKVYSRTDFIAHVVNTRYVDLTASLSFHATHRVFGFWQQIGCRFYIDNMIWKNRRDRSSLQRPRLMSTF